MGVISATLKKISSSRLLDTPDTKIKNNLVDIERGIDFGNCMNLPNFLYVRSSF